MGNEFTSSSTSGSAGSSYQSDDEAAELVASIPPMMIAAYLLSANAAYLGQAREMAADDIDARPYQGSKYDPTQARQFPRVPYGSGVPIGSTSYPLSTNNTLAIATEIWDIDTDGTTVIVPLDVRKAEIFQANFLLSQGSGGDRIQAAIDSGLASQSVGGMSESYRESVKKDWGYGLTPRARALLEKYRLKTGKIL